ncbi:hypothetical protein QBC40DRAFT_351354 [Triangularia verruculosa]|uniref:Uncharacterized protein n=1 Tax=Triangularia verruculosa TaxID=2587418 RepID=A0AAN6XFU2_9PEZI|nr:hypothetical protein QBC40DRAFT_351354 [Triangularia verruculosa]
MQSHGQEAYWAPILRDPVRATYERLSTQRQEPWMNFECFSTAEWGHAFPHVKQYIDLCRGHDILPPDLPEYPILVFGPTKTIQDISNIGSDALEQECTRFTHDFDVPDLRVAATRRLKWFRLVIRFVVQHFEPLPDGECPEFSRLWPSDMFNTGDPIADEEAGDLVTILGTGRDSQVTLDILEEFSQSTHPGLVAFKLCCAVIIKCHQIRSLPQIQPGTAQFMEHLAKMASATSAESLEFPPQPSHNFTAAFVPHAWGVRANHVNLHPSAMMIALNLFQFDRLREVGPTADVKGWKHPMYDPILTGLRNDLVRFFLSTGRKAMVREIMRVSWRVDGWFEHYDNQDRPMPGRDALRQDTLRLVLMNKVTVDEPVKPLSLLLKGVPIPLPPPLVPLDDEESFHSEDGSVDTCAGEESDEPETAADPSATPAADVQPESDHLTSTKLQNELPTNLQSQHDDKQQEEPPLPPLDVHPFVETEVQEYPPLPNSPPIMQPAHHLQLIALDEARSEPSVDSPANPIRLPPISSFPDPFSDAPSAPPQPSTEIPVYETLANVPSSQDSREVLNDLLAIAAPKIATANLAGEGPSEPRPLPPIPAEQAQLTPPPPLPPTQNPAVAADVETIREVAKKSLRFAERIRAQQEKSDETESEEEESEEEKIDDSPEARKRAKTELVKARMEELRRTQKKKAQQKAKKQKQKAKQRAKKLAALAGPADMEEAGPSSSQPPLSPPRLQAESESLQELEAPVTLSEPEEKGGEQAEEKPSELGGENDFAETAEAAPPPEPEGEEDEDDRGKWQVVPSGKTVTNWEARRQRKRAQREKEEEEKRQEEERRRKQREENELRAKEKMAKRLADKQRRWDEERHQREEQELLRLQQEAEELERAKKESLSQAEEDERRKVQEAAESRRAEAARQKTEAARKEKERAEAPLETWRATPVSAQFAAPAPSVLVAESVGPSVLPVPGSSSLPLSSTGPLPASSASPVPVPASAASPPRAAAAVSQRLPAVSVASTPNRPVSLQFEDVTPEDFARTGEALAFSSRRPVISIPEPSEDATLPVKLVPLAVDVPASPSPSPVTDDDPFVTPTRKSPGDNEVGSIEEAAVAQGRSAERQALDAPSHQVEDGKQHQQPSAKFPTVDLQDLTVGCRELVALQREQAVWIRELRLQQQEEFRRQQEDIQRQQQDIRQQQEDMRQERKELRQQQEALRKGQQELDRRTNVLNVRQATIYKQETNTEQKLRARELALDTRAEEYSRREAEVLRREQAANQRDAGIVHRLRDVGLREEQVCRRELEVWERKQSQYASSAYHTSFTEHTSSVENASSAGIIHSPETESEAVGNQGVPKTTDPETRYNRNFQGTGRSRSSEPVSRRTAANVRQAQRRSGP